MTLNISRIRRDDYGDYSCVAKNEQGLTKGNIMVLDSKTPYRSYSENEAIYGQKPPERVSYEELCPPQAPCECTDQRDVKCKDSVYNVFDLTGGKKIESELMNNSVVIGPQNKTTDCILYAVGKPVYHKYTEQNYGSWLKDTNPKNDAIAEKIWSTNENETSVIYEFPNKTAYRDNIDKNQIRLETPWQVCTFSLHYLSEINDLNQIFFCREMQISFMMDIFITTLTGPRI